MTNRGQSAADVKADARIDEMISVPVLTGEGAAQESLEDSVRSENAFGSSGGEVQAFLILGVQTLGTLAPVVSSPSKRRRW
jgi:hypothetical protein